MAGFTPGPWTIADADCFDGEPAPTGLTGVSGAGWSDLAFVWTRLQDEPFDNPEGVANACLIAAAPELLEALELADAALSGANMNMSVVENKVRAAISKATGGDQ